MGIIIIIIIIIPDKEDGKHSARHQREKYLFVTQYIWIWAGMRAICSSWLPKFESLWLHVCSREDYEQRKLIKTLNWWSLLPINFKISLARKDLFFIIARALMTFLWHFLPLSGKHYMQSFSSRRPRQFCLTNTFLKFFTYVLYCRIRLINLFFN